MKVTFFITEVFNFLYKNLLSFSLSSSVHILKHLNLFYFYRVVVTFDILKSLSYNVYLLSVSASFLFFRHQEQRTL
tara:strand:+ start:230 stop:457 length:228 start_codon:yes stop_codon:yes gene_type:complete